MKWLVTGARGMLAQDLLGRLATAGNEHCVGLGRAELDVTDRPAVHDTLRDLRPDLVVHCAAYTAVEDAEEHQELAHRVNGLAPGHLADACAAVGARLLHISTDYVFGGDRCVPYPEDGATGARTAYGRSKLVGERAVLSRLPNTGVVLRTAWLYATHGHNFVLTMRRRACDAVPSAVVADQYGQPTFAPDVVDRIVTVARRPALTGVFHATNAGVASWYELAREVYRLSGADPALVRPISAAEYPSRVPRPRYTALGHGRWRGAGIPVPRHWRHALREALAGPPGRSSGPAQGR